MLLLHLLSVGQGIFDGNLDEAVVFFWEHVDKQGYLVNNGHFEFEFLSLL
jgi:hypothetical protein